MTSYLTLFRLTGDAPLRVFVTEYLKNGSTDFHLQHLCEIKKLKTGYLLLPIGNQLMRKCLARKHDQNGIFCYYFLLILTYFKSDEGETW